MPKVNGSGADRNTATGWTSTQAYITAIICLLIGVAVGYLVRGSALPDQAAANVNPTTSMAANEAPMPQVTPDQLKRMADQQAAPQQPQSLSNAPLPSGTFQR